MLRCGCDNLKLRTFWGIGCRENVQKYTRERGAQKIDEIEPIYFLNGPL